MSADESPFSMSKFRPHTYASETGGGSGGGSFEGSWERVLSWQVSRPAVAAVSRASRRARRASVMSR
jgi:hypothetical protein